MVVPYLRGGMWYVDNRQPARKGTLDMVGRYLSTSLSLEKGHNTWNFNEVRISEIG